MKWFKKKKEDVKIDTPKPINNVQSIHHHESRISNLCEEYDIVSKQVSSMELDNEMPRSIKNKNSDIAIFRMAVIEYEVIIRKELLNGLIHKLV